MGLHLAAFGANVALISTNQPLPLVPEGYLSQDSSGNALCPVPMKLMSVYSFGVGMDKNRVIVPSLKRISFPRIAHWDVVAQAPTNPNIESLMNFPFPIGQTESWEFQSDNSNAGAQNHFSLAFLQDAMTPVPPGPSWVFEGTGAAVAALRTWSQSVITWEDTYPSLNYAVVGLRVTGANVVAARLIPPYAGPRPGCIGTLSESVMDRSWTWDGRFGSLMTFRPPVFPQLEVLGNGATAAQRVYLQVVPIGPAI